MPITELLGISLQYAEKRQRQQILMTIRLWNCFILLLPAILLLFPSAYALSKQVDYEIKVDPRIELLAVIQSLTSWANTDEFTHLDFKYCREVKNHFAPHKNHRAVKWMEDNLKKGFSYSAPPAAMMHLSPPPDMKVIIPFSNHLLASGRDARGLSRMVEYFNDFAEDAGFMKFWEDQQPFYREYVSRIKEILRYRDYARLIMDYYGDERYKFVFIAAPLFSGDGYGAQVGNTIYYLGGPQAIDDGLPVYSPKIARTMVFHEFGHSFVGPIVQEFKEQISEYGEFHKHIKVNSAYGTWEMVCEEHLVRMGETLLLRMAGYKEEADHNLDYNTHQGFILMPFFWDRMEIYLRNRGRYPTFRSFFPEILQVF